MAPLPLITNLATRWWYLHQLKKILPQTTKLYRLFIYELGGPPLYRLKSKKIATSAVFGVFHPEKTLFLGYSLRIWVLRILGVPPPPLHGWKSKKNPFTKLGGALFKNSVKRSLKAS